MEKFVEVIQPVVGFVEHLAGESRLEDFPNPVTASQSLFANSSGYDSATHQAIEAVYASYVATIDGFNGLAFDLPYADDALEYLPDGVMKTVNAAAFAAERFSPNTGALVRTEMCADFELMSDAIEREDWTDDTPVTPDFFGPLWREGPPAGWPDFFEKEKSQGMKFQIAVPDGMDEAQSEAFNGRVKAFLVALSRLHAEMGGNGLQIVDHDSDAPELVEDEMPGETDDEHENVPVGIGGAA